MAQGKSKKCSVPWASCEKCQTNVPNKDIDLHLEDCPPDLTSIKYNFIKDKTLYGTLDVKGNEDVKGMSSREKNNLVFLSQSAIQLCSLSIGNWAIIRYLNGNKVPVAKIVWPTIEKSITSVLLTHNEITLHGLNPQSLVAVLALNEMESPVASKVSVLLTNATKSFDAFSELLNRIQKVQTETFVTVGNVLSVMFYGKLLKLEVKCIKSDSSRALEDSFEKLSLKNNLFYKVTAKTQWTIFKDKEELKKHMEQADPFADIGGLTEEISEIREIMFAVLTTKSSISESMKASNSVLVYGNSGTGKTMLAKALALSSKAHIVTINAPDLYSKNTNSPEETIKELYEEAVANAPSVLVLDEVDILCPSRSNRMTDSEKRIVSTLLTIFDKIHENNDALFIIATSNKPDAIDPAFRRCGRLDREIEIPTPTPKSRKEIILKLLEKFHNNLNEDEIREISINTHGFVGADLFALCSRAAIEASKNGRVITFKDLTLALTKVRPSAMREVLVEVPNVKWDDIGGQADLKLILKQAVEWPLKYADSFLRLGVTPPRGVLMFGPPGCSKTMIAKALATESGLNFLSIKGPELFSKWVGESERAVREVFRKARQVAPSIVFFDEIDAIGGERNSGSSTSVQERVLAQLLTELDGVTPLGDVTVLAATNRPDRIDKALLRPGRLDRIVYVPLPNDDTRREIFKLKFRKMPVSNVDIETLVQKTQNYSGAEVNAVCHEAAMMSLEENLNATHVELRHFEKALSLVTPRTPPQLIQLYDDYMKIKS